jgi:hypothetical protein
MLKLLPARFRKKWMIILLIVFAVACSGRGCSSCQSKESCDACIKRIVDEQGVSPEAARISCGTACDAKQ